MLRHGSVAAAMVAALLAAVASAGGVAVVHHDPGAIRQGIAVAEQAGSLTVDGYVLAYDGANVTAVTVTVDNDGSSLSANVTATLRRLDGTVVASKTTSATLLVGKNDVTVTFDRSWSPADFAVVEVTASR